MKPLRKEVKRHRWKMIGHILGQDKRTDCNDMDVQREKEERKNVAPTKGQRSKRQHFLFTLRWYNLLNQFV